MPGELKKLLGEKIRKVREERGLSQRELASNIEKLSNATISQIENGKRNITLDTLEKISKGLSINVSQLVSFKKENDDFPKILKQVENQFPQIPFNFLNVFFECYKQGIKFEDPRDYKSLWKIISGLNNKE